MILYDTQSVQESTEISCTFDESLINTKSCLSWESAACRFFVSPGWEVTLFSGSRLSACALEIIMCMFFQHFTTKGLNRNASLITICISCSPTLVVWSERVCCTCVSFGLGSRPFTNKWPLSVWRHSSRIPMSSHPRSGSARCPTGARSATSATTTGTCTATWPASTRRTWTRRCTVWRAGETEAGGWWGRREEGGSWKGPGREKKRRARRSCAVLCWCNTEERWWGRRRGNILGDARGQPAAPRIAA